MTTLTQAHLPDEPLTALDPAVSVLSTSSKVAAASFGQ